MDARQIKTAQSPKITMLDCVLPTCLSTISSAPEVNTSDIDWHAHHTASVPQRKLFTLARTVADCLHLLWHDDRSRTPARPSALGNQRCRFPISIGWIGKPFRHTDRMWRLPHLPVTPELQHNLNHFPTERSAHSRSVQKKDDRRAGSSFPHNQPARRARAPVYLLIQFAATTVASSIHSRS